MWQIYILRLPSQSLDLNPIEHLPIEHLCDVVEREICITDVQLTYLQPLHDAITLLRTKISEEGFQHLVDFMPPRNKEVLTAKWGSKQVLSKCT